MNQPLFYSLKCGHKFNAPFFNLVAKTHLINWLKLQNKRSSNSDLRGTRFQYVPQPLFCRFADFDAGVLNNLIILYQGNTHKIKSAVLARCILKSKTRLIQRRCSGRVFIEATFRKICLKNPRNAFRKIVWE